METTLEVRWFGPGSPPEALAGWFAALGAPDPESRTDTYLLLAGTDDLGVKLRDGGEAFELKLRRPDHGDARSAEVAGDLERWQKWSFPLAAGGRGAAALGLPSGSLVDVEKRRRLLTYGLESDGSVAIADRCAGDGCSVELTALTVRGSEWWTFGFEAFGAEACLAHALTAAAGAVFAGGSAPGPELLAGALSCGYPAWLRLVTAPAAPAAPA